MIHTKKDAQEWLTTHGITYNPRARFETLYRMVHDAELILLAKKPRRKSRMNDCLSHGDGSATPTPPTGNQSK